MAKFRIVIHTSNKRKDGSYPVCLRITKNGKLKYIYLNLSAFENEWDKNADRFKRDKRMNPNYESYNNWLISCEERKNEVVNKFMKAQVDWTLNQFEEEFLGISRQGKIYDYWMRLSTFANEKERNLIDMCTFKNIPVKFFGVLPVIH